MELFDTSAFQSPNQQKSPSKKRSRTTQWTQSPQGTAPYQLEIQFSDDADWVREQSQIVAAQSQTVEDVRAILDVVSQEDVFWDSMVDTILATDSRFTDHLRPESVQYIKTGIKNYLRQGPIKTEVLPAYYLRNHIVAVETADASLRLNESDKSRLHTAIDRIQHALYAKVCAQDFLDSLPAWHEAWKERLLDFKKKWKEVIDTEALYAKDDDAPWWVNN
jgi:hypothetical protein